MADKQSYAPPTSPPPNYNTNKPTEHHDAGPYYAPNPAASPAPGPHNQMYPYNNQNDMMRAPDPAYGGGYYNQGPQGYAGGPPPQGYYGQGPPPQGGYYGPGQPPPQGMYYQQQPMYGHPGYYQDNRGGSSGSGICAGIMGALACCCCLDMLF